MYWVRYPSRTPFFKVPISCRLNSCGIINTCTAEHHRSSRSLAKAYLSLATRSQQPTSPSPPTRKTPPEPKREFSSGSMAQWAHDETWCLVSCVDILTARAGCSVVHGSAHNMPHAGNASRLPEGQESDLRRLSGNDRRRRTNTNTAPTLVVATLGAACFAGTAWAFSSVAPEPYMVSQCTATATMHYPVDNSRVVLLWSGQGRDSPTRVVVDQYICRYIN